MKALVLALGFGCLQFTMDHSFGLIDQTLEGKNSKIEVVVQERWTCARCNNSNGDWTSICGKCGRSR